MSISWSEHAISILEISLFIHVYILSEIEALIKQITKRYTAIQLCQKQGTSQIKIEINILKAIS